MFEAHVSTLVKRLLWRRPMKALACAGARRGPQRQTWRTGRRHAPADAVRSKVNRLEEADGVDKLGGVDGSPPAGQVITWAGVVAGDARPGVVAARHIHDAGPGHVLA